MPLSCAALQNRYAYWRINGLIDFCTDALLFSYVDFTGYRTRRNQVVFGMTLKPSDSV